MKEATGEANMTIITIVLIALVLGVGTIVITNLMTSSNKKSACAELGGTVSGSVCTYKDSKGSNATCTLSKCKNNGSYSCGTVLTCDDR